MLHNLAETAARRLGVRRYFAVRYGGAVDRMLAAYIDWHEMSIASQEAYSRCDETQGRSSRGAFAAYFAALDREARAAAEYAARVDEVWALGSRYPDRSVMARAEACPVPASAGRSTGRR